LYIAHSSQPPINSPLRGARARARRAVTPGDIRPLPLKEGGTPSGSLRPALGLREPRTRSPGNRGAAGRALWGLPGTPVPRGFYINPSRRGPAVPREGVGWHASAAQARGYPSGGGGRGSPP